MSPGRFDGQGLVVVGGTQGIGPAVVIAAAEQGASVVFGGRSTDQEAFAGIVAATRAVGAAGEVSFAPVDGYCEEDLDLLFDLAYRRLPRFSALVNNIAPLGVRDVPLAETSLNDWNQALVTQLREPFLLSRRAIEEFLAGGEGGRIVHVTFLSGGGVSGSPCRAASYTALGALIRSVVKEYGRRGIACNAVAIHGTLTVTSPPSSQSPAGHPESIAETVLFFASDEASFVNGEVVHVGSVANARERRVL